MSRIILKNGTLVDPAQGIHGPRTLVLEGGRVTGVLAADAPEPAGAEILDCRGKIIAPGLIDLHVHFREPGHEYKETVRTGSMAAAAGGFTSVACMANTDPVNDSPSVTEYILEKARAADLIHVFPIGAATRGLAGERIAEYGELAAAGCIMISDDGRTVMNAEVMRRALEYASDFDLPISVHAEDTCLCGDGVMHEGDVSTSLGLPGKPAASEDVIVARDIALAELTGAHVHFAHISSAGAVRRIRDAKAQGLRVTCEVTPHHLMLTEEAVRSYDPNTKMNPPLRSDRDRDALRAGLADGTIDCIATDHAPHSAAEKEVEFVRAAVGVIGLETSLPLCLGLVRAGLLTLDELIRRMSTTPSEVARLGRGTLAEGTPADVVVFDPDEAYKLDPRRGYSKSRNTPFGGWEVQGRVHWTIVEGRVVYTPDGFVNEGRHA
ncbi:MAG: dihydroorotase [Myxococcales bacterium]|nr:dihydroorotase [Myxococcales bacterium]